eukprot:CAMPEP_0204266596 /NCGR_PEP_ID=MMETSP0468-20130131/10423_1 /ASSEMBLY_ACC=CAM_ASM_000383 /TAXON_ID=2969 /ORGANISM="Oxyrrhis marina" /LENGTH=139 /DNA_ID=CAMNT_0051241679 /DNA_START=46 /DNA_END=467 /DNA_ORIENTATION=-
MSIYTRTKRTSIVDLTFAAHRSRRMEPSKSLHGTVEVAGPSHRGDATLDTSCCLGDRSTAFCMPWAVAYTAPGDRAAVRGLHDWDDPQIAARQQPEQWEKRVSACPGWPSLGRTVAPAAGFALAGLAAPVAGVIRLQGR